MPQSTATQEEKHRVAKKEHDESNMLNETAAGAMRSLSRLLAAYPRFKFFRPKMKPNRFEKFQSLAPATIQAAPSLPKARLLPFFINLVSGVALFRVYDTSKPAQAGVLDCARSGAFGGLVHGLIMHPFEVMLMSGVRTWSQLPACVRTLRPAAVVLSAPLTVARDTLGFALFFGVYEGVREYSGRTGIVTTAIAGTAGAAAHHLVAYPSHTVRDLLGHDAIRSTPSDIIRVVRQNRNILFDGCGRSMLGALPTGALTFVVYEAMLTPIGSALP